MAIVARNDSCRASSKAPLSQLRPDVQPRARVRRPIPPSTVSTPEGVQAAVAPTATKSAKCDYDVGYCKPPKHSQFQKGTCYNKKGRPKGARGLKTIARELLSEKITVRTAAGLKRMRKIEAMVHKVMEKAFAGDMRAIQSLMQLYASSVPDEPVLAAALADMPAVHSDEHDAAILEALRQTLREGGDS